MSDTCDSLEALSAATSIITAIGTLLIALVAQLYSSKQAAMQEIEAKRKELQEACNEIQTKAALSLFWNQLVETPEGNVYIKVSRKDSERFASFPVLATLLTRVCRVR